MNKFFLLALGLLVLGAACTKQTTTSTQPGNSSVLANEAINAPGNSNASNTNTTTTTPVFSNPKKSAHYETNTPAHGAILPAVPVNVVIDFNFDLSVKSTISIVKDGQEYGTGATTVDTNKLTLRRAMNPEAPDGTYTVEYNACWPDNSCHDGRFQFAIDWSRAAAFTDLRNQTNVTVNLKDIAFAPMNIRVSKGTTVTWVNDDTVEHYVNTDSHPAHTYHLSQNSKALATGDTFKQRFDTAGIYPYHCSAHADVMQGSIIVE